VQIPPGIKVSLFSIQEAALIEMAATTELGFPEMGRGRTVKQIIIIINGFTKYFKFLQMMMKYNLMV